jgi:uncharacterized phage protein (TIGR02220 family)
VFLSEIDSLSGRTGCYASNGYFSKFFGLSKSRVSNVISSLQKHGLIEIKMITSESGRNVEKRIIRPTGYDRPIAINVENEQPVDSKRESFIDESRRIIDYLNEKTGASYKSSSKSTQRHINARLSEGFTVVDFHNVITDRVRVWGHDDKMKEFIRPETLFGTKFESYLNNAPKKQTNQKPRNTVDFGERKKPNS